MTKVDENERRRILTLLAAGATCRETAAIVGRAPSTISTTARAAGINLQQHTRTTTRKRLETALERAETISAALEDPGAVGKWAVALAELLDAANYGTPDTLKKDTSGGEI